MRANIFLNFGLAQPFLLVAIRMIFPRFPLKLFNQLLFPLLRLSFILLCCFPLLIDLRQKFLPISDLLLEAVVVVKRKTVLTISRVQFFQFLLASVFLLFEILLLDLLIIFCFFCFEFGLFFSFEVVCHFEHVLHVLGILFVLLFLSLFLFLLLLSHLFIYLECLLLQLVPVVCLGVSPLVRLWVYLSVLGPLSLLVVSGLFMPPISQNLIDTVDTGLRYTRLRHARLRNRSSFRPERSRVAPEILKLASPTFMHG